MTEETTIKQVRIEMPMELYEKMQKVIRARNKREQGYEVVERGDIQRIVEEAFEIGLDVIIREEELELKNSRKK